MPPRRRRGSRISYVSYVGVARRAPTPYGAVRNSAGGCYAPPANAASASGARSFSPRITAHFRSSAKSIMTMFGKRCLRTGPMAGEPSGMASGFSPIHVLCESLGPQPPELPHVRRVPHRIVPLLDALEDPGRRPVHHAHDVGTRLRRTADELALLLLVLRQLVERLHH